MTPGIGKGIGIGLRKGGARPAWVPTDLGANLKLWLRPEELAVIGDTNNVSTWADQSGLSNDATQGTADKQPVVAADKLDGYAEAVLDGVDDSLEVPQIDLGTGAFEYWIVVHLPALAEYFMRGMVGGTTRLRPEGLGHLAFQTPAGSTNLTAVSTFAGDTRYLIRVGRDGSANMICEKNGVDVISGSPTNAGNVSLITPWNYTTTGQVHGIELMVVSAAVSAANLTNARSYFAGRYPTLGIA